MTRCKLVGIILVIGAGLLVTTTAGGASHAVRLKAPSFFTGYGFDTCGAPSLASMQAWQASPYRAVGIYLGGVNRACPDGNLTPAWVNSVRAGGWNLLPLWVGRQAPCVSQPKLELITPASAGSQGKAAADSAAARAAYFGIGAGYPIYFDMEGYATNASCTTAVQRFVAAWVNELHAKGYAAGVYGSAASTIRDLVAMLESGSGSVPDDIWIARWNGDKDVFGDPVVSDSYWSEHQRIHQYRGGHKETWGGVKLNIDSNYVDGAVVEAVATLPAEPPAGTVTSSDGLASVSWWENSFSTPTTVTLTPSTLATPVQGFAAGGYVLQLGAADTGTAAPLTRFGTLLSIRVSSPAAGVVAAFSSDGLTWTPIRRLSSAALSLGQTSGYQVKSDGSLEIYTLVPGFFGLFHDITAPTAPGGLHGRLKKGKLLLGWQKATDNSGEVAGYRITLNGAPIQTVAGTSTKTSLTRFKKKGWSVYRVIAVDGSSNQSAPSQSVAVVKVARPRGLPRAIPAWAWRLLKWQSHGRKGARPQTPRRLPGWYWHWAGWKLSPYRLAG